LKHNLTGSPIEFPKLIEELPIKQGLKLSMVCNSHHYCLLIEELPIKQGLKPCK